MNQLDKERFRANITWFNEFYAGLRQIYEVVAEELEQGFVDPEHKFTSGNHYYEKTKYAPTIPGYYTLMLPLKELALQVYAIFDEELIRNQKYFVPEPSLIVVVHSQKDKFAYLRDYGLRVVGDRDIDAVMQENGFISGTINSKEPARFFAFQVSFDQFSSDNKPHDVIQEMIVEPIINNLDF